MAQEKSVPAAGNLFAEAAKTPAAQALLRRVEEGGALSCAGVSAAAQPFLAAFLRQAFPKRPVVVVTDGLKTQESFQQDLETWGKFQVSGLKFKVKDPQPSGASETERQTEGNPLTLPSPPRGRGNQSAGHDASGKSNFQPLFYPAWEILPHEAKLPHADVISERLETLVALTAMKESLLDARPHPGPLPRGEGEAKARPGDRPRGLSKSRLWASVESGGEIQVAPMVVTSVVALLQKTFSSREMAAGTRTLKRGDRVEPLDLVEWLEEQGYEPEAQVTQRGDMAMRGGILDVYPMTSPWPVRLEFFGDELESLRHFDPLTQVSRDQITSVTLPPGGELGILKQVRSAELGVRNENQPELATLVDYLPPETIFLVCEPESVAAHADQYGAQVPENDLFYFSWEEFQEQLAAKGMTVVEVSEVRAEAEFSAPMAEEDVSGTLALTPALSPELLPEGHQENQRPVIEDAADAGNADAETVELGFASLDAFRPLGARAPEPQIAEAQRREFFAQLHRWARQGHAVHVFCNNDGERQRFGEVWKDYGFGDWNPASGRTCPILHLGALARGFLCEDAKLVVVTDAEIFGRYKVQRPRRLKSAHAQAARSALDIDFTEFEEGDYVVHLAAWHRALPGLEGAADCDGAEAP